MKGGKKGMVLRATTQKADLTRFGALVVEKGEGAARTSFRFKTQVCGGAIEGRVESTRESRSGGKLFGAVGFRVVEVLVGSSRMQPAQGLHSQMPPPSPSPRHGQSSAMKMAHR